MKLHHKRDPSRRINTNKIPLVVFDQISLVIRSDLMSLKWTVTESVSQWGWVTTFCSSETGNLAVRAGLSSSGHTFTPACNYANAFTSNFIVRDFKWHVDDVIVVFASFRRLTCSGRCCHLWCVFLHFEAVQVETSKCVIFCIFESAIFTRSFFKKKLIKTKTFKSNRSSLGISRLSVYKPCLQLRDNTAKNT